MMGFIVGCRCILLDPHMAEAHANLANALQQIGNFDLALIYYQVHTRWALQTVLYERADRRSCHR